MSQAPAALRAPLVKGTVSGLTRHLLSGPWGPGDSLFDLVDQVSQVVPPRGRSGKV